MNLILGVDAGLNGALSFLDLNSGKLISAHPMPTTIAAGQKALNLFETAKVKRKVSPNGLLSLLSLLIPEYMILSSIVIERVSASPQMGVTSAFSFGEGYGILIGILSALYPDSPIHFVTPSVWKMRLNVTKDKSLSNELAKQLFPSHANYFKKKDAGLAESALIAYYGYKYLQPNSKNKTE